ncbi:MAG: hypothetical protein Q8Q36_01985 [bacterium]|nr:hypothetical protein [bacterium]
MTFDRDRAEQVMEAAHAAYHARTHLYLRVHGLNGDAPQRKYRPEGVVRGSPDDLIRLYFATLTDRRQLSAEVYKAHVRLWQSHEWLYREDVLALKECETLEKILREEKAGTPKESAKTWLPCAETLYSTFGGDPRKLFAGGSISAALEWKYGEEKKRKRDPLPGFGPKILSLLAIFYEELGAIQSLPDAFPVDMHIQRIFISTGAVSAPGIEKSAGLAEFLRFRLCEICSERKWKPLELSQAFWFLGNQTCTRCYLLKDAHLRCPVYEECGGAIESRSYFKRGEWDFNAPRRPKGIPVKLLF